MNTNSRKHQWRKDEKNLYLPKKTPQIIDIGPLHYFSIKGEGNPNGLLFSQMTEALYAISYALKMSYKTDNVPLDYYDYTVYPLEGIWDLIDVDKGPNDKDNLKFNIMIRQPDFLTPELAETFKTIAYEKKKNPHILNVQYITLNEGLNLQALHQGSYDDEPATFSMMENYAKEQGYQRMSKTHKEIYITDPRKVDPDQLKTVLRFKIEKIRK
jgi:hypothetical protein